MMGDDGIQRSASESELQSGVEQPEWVVAKSLLDVENTCTNTLEEFLLYATTDRADGLPAAEFEARLDELIAKQKRAVAEMELAKRALSEIDSE